MSNPFSGTFADDCEGFLPDAENRTSGSGERQTTLAKFGLVLAY
jgi:hypothetical protein